MFRIHARSWMALLAVAAAARAGSAQVPAAPLVDAVRAAADVRLEWVPLPDATNYRVYRTADLAQPFVEIGQTPAPPFVDPGAVPGPPLNPALLFYHVRAENGSGLGPPSNLAFKANLTIANTKVPIPISLPYRFYPTGVVGAPATSKDLCAAFPGLAIVRRWDDLGNGCHSTRLQLCSSPNPNPVFAYVQAAAYLVQLPDSAPSLVLDVVGAHDPAFEPGASQAIALATCPSCSAPGHNLVNVPYHAQARRASELCDEFRTAGQPVFAIQDWDLRETAGPVHYCGSTYRDFDLAPGNAYAILVKNGAIWQPRVR